MDGVKAGHKRIIVKQTPKQNDLNSERRTIGQDILHCADKVGVHLTWSRSVPIVVHQLISHHFVKLIFDGLR
jgi:hypothetical protein